MIKNVPQKLEGHEYPFEEVGEQPAFCYMCDEEFSPKIVYEPVLIESNECIRKDTVEYTTVCPTCGKHTKAYFVYYYD